ncbi:glycosyltransferase [Bradyrhizobium sp. F1.13.3]|uniref:glycosyltransferase n=1 Tax=Bradyrhizobium sp. F1.13.3 TaxID=3156351 RepID=UPI0033931667
MDAGGIDEFVAFLARRLPDRGIRSTVMITEPAATGGRLMRALQEEGIEVIHKSPSESPGWLRRQRPDVISAHAPPDWLLQAAHELGISVVETLHAAPTPIGTNWRAEGTRSRNIRFLIAVSDLVRRQYLRGNPAFNADAIYTIPNGFNSTHRQMTDRAAARKWLGLQDEFLFVSLARHVMQKNAYGLLVAFAEVAKLFPHAHLVLAGRADDPVYMKQLQLLQRNIPERHRIHLRDNLSNPSPLLSAADCFVLNSFFEGWPLAPMEALCTGLPVVMSDVGGAREQIGLEGRHGHLVPNPLEDPETVTWDRVARERFRPQRNRAALVSAMTSIIENREHWTASRATLASEAKVRFNTEACIERYAQVLEQAVAS